MKHLRKLSVLLLMTVLFTSCQKSDAPADADTDTAPDTSDTAVQETQELPDIPAELRFEGVPFRMLAPSSGNFMGKNLDEFDIESSADVLTQAIYDRVINVEERFGITMEFNYVASREVEGLARQSITSDSDDYDIVWGIASYTQSTVYEGLYMPVSDLPYVDLDKPWWNKRYIESVSVNSENPYILFGSINHNSLERSVCTFVNIDMLTKLKGLTEQDMYDIVLEGKWTLDKLTELCRDAYNDENGNTVRDAADTYGFVHQKFWQVDFMAYAAGLELTARDNDGYPMLNLNNERSVTLAEKLLALFVNNVDSYNSLVDNEYATIFGEGRSLFLVNRFFLCSWKQLRESDVSYAIIPSPKLDETIESYNSPVERLVQWGMVPTTVGNPTMVSAVAEQLAYEGYIDVMPAYYETTLKFKYTRGDLDGASQMLDLITANQYTDFMCANSLGGMEKLFIKVVQSGENTFASQYAKLESTANTKLEEYIDTLK